MSSEPTRREWLKTTGIGITAALTGGGAANAIASNEKSRERSGSVRVAHLTDFHVQPEDGAPHGVAMCLRHVQSLKHKPDLIFNTGDCIMNALHEDRARTQQQWDVWNKIMRDELSTPIKHCMGNHDVWGWAKDQSKTTGDEPGWGKKWAMDELGLDKPYHAFDCGGWRLIMLDSIFPSEEGVWEARLDEQQFAWLQSELASTRKPIMIGSHVPLLSAAVLLDFGRTSGTPEYPALAPRRSHLDVRPIGQLFARHPNVKLCVSGHLHQIDRADYRGVSYITNPAVSGGWWRGNHMEVFGAMYTLIDLHADGTFDITYEDFGWTPQNPATQPVNGGRMLLPAVSPEEATRQIGRTCAHAGV